MAELRLGHDQAIFNIDAVYFHDGRLEIRASGFADEKTEKLTGPQPIVIVDEGKIVVTWHNDFTEVFDEARKVPRGTHFTFFQPLEFISITSMDKKNAL